MTRVPTMPLNQLDPHLQEILEYGRQGLKYLTGRGPKAMAAPMELYARVPVVLRAYAALEEATAQMDCLNLRLLALANLKAATLTQCEYCIDLGSQVSRQWGFSDEELLALPNYRNSALFSEVEQLVMDYAAGMSRTPVDVSDDLVSRLREHLSDTEIVALTHIVALENMRCRFNLALGVGAAGFSEGLVCAVPATA